MILNPNGPGGWVLDGFGGLSPFNGAPALTISAYWPGWDIARAAAGYNGPNGLTGYVMDGWGGLHAVNNADAHRDAVLALPRLRGVFFLAITP